MVRSPGHLFASLVYSLFGARGATAARNGLDALDLFAGTGVHDKVPHVHDALAAGVGPLEAGVVRLYGVVVVLGRWVRAGCARLTIVHKRS
jgi:hypothetical protein